jgi:hypothetical protein
MLLTPDLVQGSTGGKQTDRICDTLYQYKRVWVLIDKICYQIMYMLLDKFGIIDTKKFQLSFDKITMQ